MKTLMKCSMNHFTKQVSCKKEIYFEEEDFSFMHDAIQWFNKLNKAIADGKIPDTLLFNHLIDEIFTTYNIISQ